MPAALFQGPLSLTRLALALPQLVVWPEDFLVAAPFLTDLALALPQLLALPPDFLAHTPYLSRLVLGAPSGRQIPWGTPDLSRREDPSADEPPLVLPRGLQEPLPYLTRLTLHIDRMRTWPQSTLAYVPRLESLVVQVC